MGWREEKPTQRQIDCIKEMLEFSEYPIPYIDVKAMTKGEASDYIDAYGKIGHTSTVALIHGWE